MLTVEDTDGSGWLDIVELLSEQDDYDMVLFPYPGSGGDPLPAPFGLPAAPPPLEFATTYPEGTEPSCSARVRVTAALIDDLRRYVDEFEDWGDSMALYALRGWGWAAAFITHERRVLIRDVHAYGFLDAAGIPVCEEAPEGSQSQVLQMTWPADHGDGGE